MKEITTIVETEKDSLDLSAVLVENEHRHLEIVNLFRKQTLSIAGNIILNKGATLDIVQIDLGNFNLNLALKATLYDKATFNYHVASLSDGQEIKTYRADVVHIGQESRSLTAMFGVCSGVSQLTFLGASDIRRGAVKTNTRQEGKIINLSGKAKCVSSPSLLIGEEDVYASHGASMGSVPDFDMFYLMSRGLDERAAKKLVTIGYLKPIALMLKDQKTQQATLDLLEKEI